MRIAVVGTGSIGQRHLRNLLALGYQEVLAISEHGRRDSLTVEGTPIELSHSFADALEGVDAVFICSPTSLHLDYLRHAVEAGRHVYLEKPVAPTSSGFEPILTQIEEQRLVVAVGTQFRFNPMLVRLRNWIAEGRLGTLINVFAYSGEHIADYHPDEDYRESYAAKSALGGGVLLTQIHQIDYLNWLFGPFDDVSASQVDLPDLQIDVESAVSYQLVGQRNVPVSGHLNYVQRPRRTGMQVVGTDAFVEWRYEENALYLTPAHGDLEHVSEPFDRNRMFLDGLRDFFEAIRSGAKPRATLEDGIGAVALVESIKRCLSIDAQGGGTIA